MDTIKTFAAVRACAELILRGIVLQTEGVSAGNGRVIDWRTVKSGETLQEGGDAFDAAQFFVAMVGPEAAIAVTSDEATTPPPFVAPPPHITAYMQTTNGGRRRSFEIGEFQIYVEPHENDEWQAAFTARIAGLIAAEHARQEKLMSGCRI